MLDGGAGGREGEGRGEGGRWGLALPPRMIFWLPTMFDFRETLFPVS